MGFSKREAFEAYLKSDGSVPFDLHAQDANDWLWLQEFIPGLVISSAGGAAPFQAEGMLEEYPFYFRSEQGGSTLTVATHEGVPYLHTGDVLWIGKSEAPEEYSYAPLPREVFVGQLYSCVLALEPAPFLWKFLGRKIAWRDKTDPSTVYSLPEADEYAGWGMNPKEGFEACRKFWSSSNVSSLFTEQAWHMMAVDPSPFNNDERHYPVQSPAFLKLSERFTSKDDKQ